MHLLLVLILLTPLYCLFQVDIVELRSRRWNPELYYPYYLQISRLRQFESKRTNPKQRMFRSLFINLGIARPKKVLEPQGLISVMKYRERSTLATSSPLSRRAPKSNHIFTQKTNIHTNSEGAENKGEGTENENETSKTKNHGVYTNKHGEEILYR